MQAKRGPAQCPENGKQQANLAEYGFGKGELQHDSSDDKAKLARPDSDVENTSETSVQQESQEAKRARPDSDAENKMVLSSEEWEVFMKEDTVPQPASDSDGLRKVTANLEDRMGSVVLVAHSGISGGPKLCTTTASVQLLSWLQLR